MKQFSFFHPKSLSLKVFCFTFILVGLIGMQGWGQATYTAKTDGSWNSTSTWSIGVTADGDGDGIPDANDIVIIPTKNTITLNRNESCASIEINGSGNPATLAIQTFTLSVSGNILGNGTRAVLSFTTGALNIGGNLSGLTTFTVGTGTVNYNGAAQNVYPTIYNNLTLSGSGTKTMSGPTTVTSFVTIDPGVTLDEDTRTMTLPGGATIVVNGTLDFSTNTGKIQNGSSGTTTLILGANGKIKTVDPSGLGPLENASLHPISGGTWVTTSISTNGTVEYYHTSAQTVTARTYNNLTLSNTGTKTFSGAVTAANLTIKPEASVTISTGITVSVGTAFLIESSTTTGETGSLKVEGTGALSGSGSKSVQRFLPTEDWHLISSPVTGLTLSSFATDNGIQLDGPTQTYDIGPYNEGTDLWVYPGTGSFEIAKGYSTERTLAAGAGLATFTGTGIYTGNQTVGLTCDKNGWNCIGNPFTSAIKATGTGTDNLIGANKSQLDPIYAALYFWNNSTGQYDALSNSSTNNYASVGQGFIVNSINGGGTFAFNTNMQFHQNGAIFKDAEIPWPAVTLKAEAGDFRCTTLINFNEAMTTALDPTYDAGMFKGNPNIALYSRLVSGDNPVDFSVQSLPPSQTGSYRIPVGLDLPDGGEVSFTAETLNLSTGDKVILEDVQSQTFTDLGAEGAKYTTVVAAKASGTGRFYLHTGENSVTAVRSLAKPDFTVFTRDRIITINGEAGESTDFSIYNIEGKQFAKLRARKLNQNTIDATGFPSGVYLLRINNKGRQQVAKLVLMN